MSRRTFGILFFAAIIAFPLFGAYTMTPSSGPTAGGTEVTLTGDFGAWPYVVLFGNTAAVTRRIDEHTLVATTPAHLPGDANVVVFEYDVRLATGLTFRYQGGVPEAYERLLLPIFMDPVRGLNGSEFVTEFSARLQQGASARIFGIQPACPLAGCIPWNLSDVPYELTQSNPAVENFVFNGNPGRFIYVPRAEVGNLAMNLRVYDQSRTALNFGTEMPVVRESRFTEGYTLLTLLNVPTDARFRNTLRIYGTGVIGVEVTAARTTPYGPLIPPFPPVVSTLELRAGANIFEPATATFTNFPVNVGPIDVSIAIPTPPITPPAPPRIWAFITVTNNDTQLITTITPQP